MADRHDVWVSPAALFRVPVQGAEPIFAAGTGVQIGTLKEITAEFGEPGREVPRLDANGEQVHDEYTGAPLTTVTNMRSGLFDLQEQAQAKGWTPEEVALVKAKLEYVEKTDPQWVRRHTAPPLSPPVPTYDNLHHKQIPTLMEQLGLASQALAYERENKNRAEVVAKLEEILNKDRVEQALVAE